MDSNEEESLLYEKPLYIKEKQTYKPKTVCDFKSNRAVTPKGYYEYLKSSRWAWYRSKILKRDNYECTECQSKENLNIHHLTYRNLGNEQMKDLITLCKDCHEKAHKYDLDKDAKKSLLKELEEKYIRRDN